MWICHGPSLIAQPPRATAMIVMDQSANRAIAMPADRRQFLTSVASSVATSVASGALLLGCARPARGTADPSTGTPGEEDEVTPAEDLMREHGVLRRVMYLYDEAAHRFDAKLEVPLDALAGCAGIIRRVIEDYHEKLE